MDINNISNNLFDVIVVGAGPAGSTAALLLAKAGWSVALIEKKIFPRRKVCGEFISATNLPLLQKIGIADFYLSHSGPEIKRVGIMAKNTVLSSVMPSATHSSIHWGKALGREHFDHKLLHLSQTAGVTIFQPWIFKKFERVANLFTCSIVSHNINKHIQSPLLIMANGSWEKVGKSIKSSDLLAFKAHFKNCKLAPELMPLLVFPGGYGGLVHTDSDRVTLSCCIRRDYLKNVRLLYPGLMAGEAVFKYINATCAGISPLFCDAQREGDWLAAGPIKPAIRQRYADGIFYIGNIAGEAHPIIAEGISMGLQSAWLLSNILLTRQKEILCDKNMTIAGKEYIKVWNKQFKNRIHAATLFAQLAMRPWVVSLLLPILKMFPSILTLGAKWSGKIKSIAISTKLTSNEKESTTSIDNF